MGLPVIGAEPLGGEADAIWSVDGDLDLFFLVLFFGIRMIWEIITVQLTTIRETMFGFFSKNLMQI